MLRSELRRGDVVLSYLDSGGAGPVVVLLHGLGGSAQEMAATAQALRDGYRVLAVDQRGHGHSTRRPVETSRRAHVEDVAAVVHAVAGEAPMTLVGQSVGAHTALLVAAWYPQLVDRLVLLEGDVGGEGPHRAVELGAWVASWPVPFSDRQAVAGFFGSTPTAQAWAQDLEQRGDGLWPRFDADVMQTVITPVAATAWWEQWRQVQAPTLLVQGAQGILDAEQVQRMLVLRPATQHTVVGPWLRWGPTSRPLARHLVPGSARLTAGRGQGSHAEPGADA